MSLIPLKQATGVDVAKALYKRWITVFGSPESIHSDRGTEFENRVIREMCTIFGIRKTKSSPYYPRGNGMIERLFRTTKDMVYATMKTTGKNWTEVLPAVEMAMRCTKHSVTKFSPYEVVFGKTMTTPLTHGVNERDNSKREYSTCEYIKSIQTSLQRIHELMRKKRNTKGLNEFPDTPYDDSTMVMAKIFPEARGLKFPRYEGPYTIIKRRGWCYTLKHMRTGKIIERNHYHIKKFNGNGKQREMGTSVESLTVKFSDNHNVTRQRPNTLPEGRTEKRYPTRNRKQPVRLGIDL